jgi:hypothetical protein
MTKVTPFLIFNDQPEAAMMTMVKLDVAALERVYSEA